MTEPNDQNAPATPPAGEPQGQPQDAKPNAAAAEDVSARIKELEAQNTRLAQEKAEAERTLDFVRPYVNFQPAEPVADNPAPTNRSGGHDVDGNYVSREEFQRMQDSMNSQLKATEFLRDNPDLKPYENLVAVELQRINDPLLTVEQRMAKAGEKVRTFLEAERQKGLEEAKKKAVAEDEATMAGLDRGSSPTPANQAEPKTEGQSAADYIAERRRDFNKVAGQY
jgi:hypothetical protein